MAEQKLSKLEHKLLSYIARYVDRYGFQPSYREIALEWGYRSPGYISALVAKLKERGVVFAAGARAIEFNYKHYIDAKEPK